MKIEIGVTLTEAEVNAATSHWLLGRIARAALLPDRLFRKRVGTRRRWFEVRATVKDPDQDQP